VLYSERRGGVFKNKCWRNRGGEDTSRKLGPTVPPKKNKIIGREGKKRKMTMAQIQRPQSNLKGGRQSG